VGEDGDVDHDRRVVGTDLLDGLSRRHPASMQAATHKPVKI
jgi:hypothetical protein